MRMVAVYITVGALVGFTGGCGPESEDTGSGSTAGNVAHLSDGSFARAIENGVTLVDFWAPWCAPCRVQGPIVDRVAARVGARARVAKLNVDDNAQTSREYGVSSIPTLIVFKDGTPVKRFVGVQEEATLIAAVEAALN